MEGWQQGRGGEGRQSALQQPAQRRRHAPRIDSSPSIPLGPKLVCPFLPLLPRGNLLNTTITCLKQALRSKALYS